MPFTTERKGKMNTTPKMHRPTAIIAAVVMCLFQLMNMPAEISHINSSLQGGLSAVILPLFTTVVDIVVTVLLVAVLFRGKKDTAAGVIFLLVAFVPLFKAGWNALSALAGFDMLDYVLATVLRGLVSMAFFGMAAVECIGQGKVSAGGGWICLWLFPILNLVLAVLSNVCMYREFGVGTSDMISQILVYTLPQQAGTILMGVSLAVRTQETE